jgi:hypothetical protein
VAKAKGTVGIVGLGIMRGAFAQKFLRWIDLRQQLLQHLVNRRRQKQAPGLLAAAVFDQDACDQLTVGVADIVRLGAVGVAGSLEGEDEKAARAGITAWENIYMRARALIGASTTLAGYSR